MRGSLYECSEGGLVLVAAELQLEPPQLPHQPLVPGAPPHHSQPRPGLAPHAEARVPPHLGLQVEGVGAHEAEAAAPGLQLQQPPLPLAAVGPHQHAEVTEVAARVRHGEGGLASLTVSPITARQTGTR